MATADLDHGLLALKQPPSPECSGRVIQASLRTLRRHLDMEIGFVGRFERGRRRFAYVDTDAPDAPIALGGSDPLEQSFCGRVATGVAPQLMVDAATEPSVADLEVTRAVGVGAHLSVPLHRVNGDLIGTLCCFSRHPDRSLRERDLGLMRLFADLVSTHMETLLRHEERVASVRTRIGGVLDNGGPAIVVQPIVAMDSREPVGFEALSRFGDVPGAAEAWDPARWFGEAGGAGLGEELETIAVANALTLLPQLPADTFLTVNVSGMTLCHEPMMERLLEVAPGRLVVEITEQEQVADYLRLAGPIKQLREAGVRLTVDDAGSGYAGLVHILELSPEIVKLDRTLCDGVTDDPARQSMITALVAFAEHQKIQLVAEGIEEAVDAETLRDLGVHYGQGYYFGRPAAV